MNIVGIALNIAQLSPIRYTAAKCSHRTRRTGNLTQDGYLKLVRMPKNKDGAVDYCLECLAKMTIQCAWCGGPIFISDPVTLYIPPDDYELPEYAVVYGEEPLEVVGCLGWHCASTGADRAGFWLPGADGKGRVFRIPTLLQEIVSGGASTIIVEDTHDLAEAVRPKKIDRTRKKHTAKSR